MRMWMCLVVLFLFSSCGKYRHLGGNWPATVVQIEGFGSSEAQEVEDSINNLNTDVGTAMLKISLNEAVPDDDKAPYPIIIKKVPQNPANPTRVGFATMAGSECTIEISATLFEAAYQDVFQSVLWHEIGHCAGLKHVEGGSEVMFKISSPFSSYTKEALERFFSALKSSAGVAS